MMQRQFRGVISLGCWICLDEFNRINIEVLSVIAQQLLELRNALLRNIPQTRDTPEGTFFFCGEAITLVDTCGVFTTMNPGYAGRTELPDNLKALFRPVAMMIPDYAAIAEILLMSEGFSDCRNLAIKMARLYKLSSEQLSQQKHYDFGMRAVKSVLEMAGKLKRQEPDDKEDSLLIRAMKDANVPKYLRDDLP
jgi:dynein heavy chain